RSATCRSGTGTDRDVDLVRAWTRYRGDPSHEWRCPPFSSFPDTETSDLQPEQVQPPLSAWRKLRGMRKRGRALAHLGHIRFGWTNAKTIRIRSTPGAARVLPSGTAGILTVSETQGC